MLFSTSRYGIGLAPDSAQYLAAARSLAAGKGFVSFDGSPYVAWPPLFPLVLAGFGLLGVDPLVAVRFLHAGTLGALVFLAGYMLFKTTRSEPIAFVGSLSALVAYPLQSVSSMLLSDALFTLLAALLLLFVARHLALGRTWDLVLGCIMAALANLQRYPGFVFCLVVAFLILFSRRGLARSKRLFQLLVFLGSAFLPVGSWLIRNLFVASTATGARTPAQASLLGKAVVAIAVIHDWFFPRPGIPVLDWVLVGLSTLLIAFLAVLTLRRLQSQSDLGGRLTRAAACFVGFYFIAVVLASATYASDEISPRLLAPIYLPLVLVLLTGINSAVRLLLRSRKPRTETWGSAALAGLLLIHPLYWNTRIYRSWQATGVGHFSQPEWQESPLVAWLRSNPLPGRILSNDPAAVYLLTGQDARISPSRSAALPKELIRPGDYLVWFARTERPSLCTPAELNRLWPLELVQSIADGGVMAAKSREGPRGTEVDWNPGFQ